MVQIHLLCVGRAGGRTNLVSPNRLRQEEVPPPLEKTLIGFDRCSSRGTLGILPRVE